MCPCPYPVPPVYSARQRANIATFHYEVVLLLLCELPPPSSPDDMHPAPSLSEAFPKDSKTEDRGQHVSHQHDQQQQQQQPQSQPQQTGGHHQSSQQLQPHQAAHTEHVQHGSHPASPTQSAAPSRKDTSSSTSTNTTDATAVSNASADTNATAYSVESSQSIFSVKDGSEISHSRRASRRRTGPLSAQQREKAALIRKLGACTDCRRRRVAVSYTTEICLLFFYRVSKMLT